MNFKHKKSLGQNFLKDEAILEQIIQAAELSAEDTILEIGPGKGALTDYLLAEAGKVIAVELDDRLVPVLKEQYKNSSNFELVHQDALTYTPPSTNYKIVANLPYYITSPLINHYLLNQENKPQIMVIMVQKEVAEKILARKGKHSVLSWQVHFFGTPELVCTVPASAFKPAPKVDSAVLKITVNKTPKLDLQKFFKLIKMSFLQKRKKLANNLAAGLHKEPAEMRQLLASLKINENARAEALTLDEWERLMNALY